MLKRSLFIPTMLMLCAPFDADAFMQAETEGTLDTVVMQVPEGDYRAVIGEFDSEKGFRTFTGGDNSKNPGKEYTVFQPPFILQDDPRLNEVKAARGLDQVIVYHKGMFLDLSDEGKLDMGKGKNVDLGKLQDAVGQLGQAGWKFTNLIGAGPVMVKVVHENDPKDDTKKYARVSRVLKIS